MASKKSMPFIVIILMFFSSPTECVSQAIPKKENRSEINLFVSLPFDYQKYIEECYLEENTRCGKKYPRVKGNELKLITRLVNEKINKNSPDIVYHIDNGGLPFETYILQIKDENEDYLLNRFIINVKKQKLVSKQLIGIEPDGEVPEDAAYTAKSFILNKDLTINLFEIRFPKIYKKLKEAYKITTDGEILKIGLAKSNFGYKAKTATEGGKADYWIGKYAFKVKNKDGLITSFSINIKSLSDIDVLYIGDSNPSESYKKLKAVNIDRDKIKIIFNKKYQELGIIYIQKNENGYLISGEPISSINPGNNEYQLKKMN